MTFYACLMSVCFFAVSKEIQVSEREGHDPHEDALAALDLVLHRLDSEYCDPCHYCVDK